MLLVSPVDAKNVLKKVFKKQKSERKKESGHGYVLSIHSLSGVARPKKRRENEIVYAYVVV